MFSFIVLSILLLFVGYKSVVYIFKYFSPMALFLAIISFGLLAILWDIRFNLINAFALKAKFPILATTDFYWFTSILIVLGVIVLRDLHRNLYFERLTTDLVRKLAIEEAVKSGPK